MLCKKLFILFFLGFLVFSPLVSCDAVGSIEDNLGASVADIVIIVLSCGIFVITAFDARIALMIAFLLYASVFIVFTLATEAGYEGFNPYYSGVAMMVCFVLLSLALLVTYKKTNMPPNLV